MFIEWVLGILLRPGTTFERAKHELRLSYWWIVLSAVTLQGVVAYYGPRPDVPDSVSPGAMVMTNTMLLVLLFDIQALFLMGTGRAFHWDISWVDALKFVGLAWSIQLIEDMILFYPALTGLSTRTMLLIDLGFTAWYLLVVGIGIRQLTGFPVGRAAVMAIMATVPWAGVLFWLNWTQL